MVYLDSIILRETGKFMEDSYTEWSQEIILLLAAVMYFIYYILAKRKVPEEYLRS